MDRERLDGWCAQGILYLVLAALVYAPLAFGAVRTQEFLVVQWLTIAAGFLWLIRFWLNPKHRLLWPEVCWSVLLFLVYAAVRYWTADIEIIAREEVVKVLVYGLLFFLILTNLHRLEAIQLIGFTLIALATAIAVYAVVQFMTDSDRVWQAVRPPIYDKRGSGTYICPNHLAGFLELFLPLSLAYTLTGRFSYLQKIFLGYASVTIFTGIVVSLSRGGWLCTGFSLLLFFLWMFRQRDYRLQSALILALLALAGAVFFWQADLSDNRREGLSLAGRTEDLRFRLWAPALEMWQDHLWWGVGPDHFDHRFRQYRPAHDQLQWRPERVHNDYLNTFADWGLTGALLVGSAWVLFFWRVIRSWPHFQRTPNDLGSSKRSNKSSFVLGGCLGLIAILVHAFLDFNMHIPANAMATVALMALVASHFRFASERFWITPHAPLRILITLTLLLGLGFLTWNATRRTAEQFWIARAEKHEQSQPDPAVAALERAFAAEDKNFVTAYELGERYRRLSWPGAEGYQELARQALGWFKKAMDLNPWDPYSQFRYGMCLDWLGDHAQAEPYFVRAAELDPNGYFTLAHVGWHYFQTEEYTTARKWLQRSLNLYWTNNRIASTYLRLVEERLAEKNKS